jgi:hypothetical protein
MGARLSAAAAEGLGDLPVARAHSLGETHHFRTLKTLERFMMRNFHEYKTIKVNDVTTRFESLTGHDALDPLNFVSSLYVISFML